MTIHWHCLWCNETGSAGVDLIQALRKHKKPISLFDLLQIHVKENLHKDCKNAIIGVKINSAKKEVSK